MSTLQPSKKIIKQGLVLHNDLEKTIAVKVENSFSHPKYHKTVSRSKKYLVHDEFSKAKTGDLVEIEQCRPYSKRKHWALKTILVRGK